MHVKLELLLEKIHRIIRTDCYFRSILGPFAVFNTFFLLLLFNWKRISQSCRRSQSEERSRSVTCGIRSNYRPNYNILSPTGQYLKT